MPIKGWLGLFLIAATVTASGSLLWPASDSGIRISSSKNLFVGQTLIAESYRKLRTGLEVTLSSDDQSIPAGKVIEISAFLNPGLNYENVSIEWRLGSGVRLIGGSLTETIPFLNRGVLTKRKIHVVFLDQNQNHQVHVVARFKENGKALGSVAQFNSRPDLIEASKLLVPPPPIPKNLFSNEPVDTIRRKPRIVM